MLFEGAISKRRGDRSREGQIQLRSDVGIREVLTGSGCEVRAGLRFFLMKWLISEKRRLFKNYTEDGNGLLR